jgi:hypothetical protein
MRYQQRQTRAGLLLPRVLWFVSCQGLSVLKEVIPRLGGKGGDLATRDDLPGGLIDEQEYPARPLTQQIAEIRIERGKVTKVLKLRAETADAFAFVVFDAEAPRRGGVERDAGPVFSSPDTHTDRLGGDWAQRHGPIGAGSSGRKHRQAQREHGPVDC